MASTASGARDIWYTPLPKSGKHGSPLMRLHRPLPSELSYLSWGRRYYGEPPLEPRGHEGWHYFVVMEGNPTLVVGRTEIVAQPGAMSIGDPDCPIGHRDQPGRACQMLTWIWRTPPTHSALRTEKGECLRLTLEPDQLRRLKHLHTQCRDAVADSNERSMLQLRVTRILIDLCLLEAYEHRQAPDAGVRIDLAVQYLRNHIGRPQMVQSLCEYLQISKASLYRLFHKHTGKGPRAFAQELRMQWAREQLHASKKSVKSVAYALGYRYPPDFSRAFKHFYGITASGVTRQSSP